MKRSEMIKIILDNICGSYELNESKVSKILIVLEASGMLPPERKVAMGYAEHSSLKRYNADPIDFFYQWEQE